MRPPPDRLRLPLACDPMRLATDLKGLRRATRNRSFVPQNYDGDRSMIPLRGKAGATHPVQMITADLSCRAFESPSARTEVLA